MHAEYTLCVCVLRCNGNKMYAESGANILERMPSKKYMYVYGEIEKKIEKPEWE